MILDSKLWAMTALSNVADCEWVELYSYLKQNDENINPIPIESFFSTICGCNHWTQEGAAPRVKDHHLERKHEVKEAHAVEERAGMQRIWNYPSQATEAKELCGAKADCEWIEL